MVSHSETTSHDALQRAKATLRDRNAGASTKAKARDLLRARGWTIARILKYETAPHLFIYIVQIKREQTRLITVPAHSARDARLAAAVMYPDWAILTADPTSP